ncbi:MAG: pyridoxal phosphate-dependent aminotransferase [Candidatus Tectomicrobia bacterium]|nr:pyridoxal phosphate-dependent aminotransferase [Candidatus Tectomicrobia bacterium]
MELAKRLSVIKPSATLEITATAKAMRAKGIDVIGFGAGEPDFDTPENIKQAAVQALNNGFTKYTVASGTDELKQAVAEKLRRENGLAYEPGDIVISCGAKHSLYNIMCALLNEGDEVIIPAPFWVSYPDQVLLVGGVPVPLETDERHGFDLDPEALRAKITPRTKMLILNSPCNPSGAGYPPRTLEAIAKIAVEEDIWVVSDEIYEHIVYDGFKHVSIASFGPEIRSRTILVNGVSKTYSMTGWRIGYAAGPRHVAKAMGMLQGQVTSNPTSFAQSAAVEALRGPQDAVRTMVAEFAKRRDVIVSSLNEIPGFRCFNPVGAFYVFPNCSELFGRSWNGKKLTTSLEVSAFLLEAVKVAVVPGAPFGAEGFLRLSYATSMKNIVEGVKRIRQAVTMLQ